MTYVTARSGVVFKNKRVFEKKDIGSVDARGAGKRVPEGYAYGFVAWRLKKGGSILSLGDHESIIGLLYLVLKYSYDVLFFNKLIEMS